MISCARLDSAGELRGRGKERGKSVCLVVRMGCARQPSAAMTIVHKGEGKARALHSCCTNPAKQGVGAAGEGPQEGPQAQGWVCLGLGRLCFISCLHLSLALVRRTHRELPPPPRQYYMTSYVRSTDLSVPKGQP
jgi:hypothetical protein